MGIVADFVEDVGGEILDVGGDIVDAVGDAVEDVGDFIVDEVIDPVVETVGTTLENMADDPLKTVATITAIATQQYWALPVINAADTAIAGGDLGDIATSAAVTYVAMEAGQLAGDYASQVSTATQYGTEVGSQQTALLASQDVGINTITQTASTVGASTARGATGAGLSGGDVVGGATSGLVSGGIGAGTSSLIDSATSAFNSTDTSSTDVSSADPFAVESNPYGVPDTSTSFVSSTITPNDYYNYADNAFSQGDTSLGTNLFEQGLRADASIGGTNISQIGANSYYDSQSGEIMSFQDGQMTTQNVGSNLTPNEAFVAGGYGQSTGFNPQLYVDIPSTVVSFGGDPNADYSGAGESFYGQSTGPSDSGRYLVTTSGNVPSAPSTTEVFYPEDLPSDNGANLTQIPKISGTGGGGLSDSKGGIPGGGGESSSVGGGGQTQTAGGQTSGQSGLAGVSNTVQTAPLGMGDAVAIAGLGGLGQASTGQTQISGTSTSGGGTSSGTQDTGTGRENDGTGAGMHDTSGTSTYGGSTGGGSGGGTGGGTGDSTGGAGGTGTGVGGGTGGGVGGGTGGGTGAGDGTGAGGGDGTGSGNGGGGGIGGGGGPNTGTDTGTTPPTIPKINIPKVGALPSLVGNTIQWPATPSGGLPKLMPTGLYTGKFTGGMPDYLKDVLSPLASQSIGATRSDVDPLMEFVLKSQGIELPEDRQQRLEESYYYYGRPVKVDDVLGDVLPEEVLSREDVSERDEKQRTAPDEKYEGFADGGLAMGGLRAGGLPHIPQFSTGSGQNYVRGAGDGQSDDIPAMLADGEYVIDAETVAQLGNGSNEAGAKILDKMREEIRKHKRSASVKDIPPKARSPFEYMRGKK